MISCSRYDDDDRWKIVVETLGKLDDVIDRMLYDLGYETYEDYEIASKQSPRATMQAFLDGTKNWLLGGQEEVLTRLDLSFSSRASPKGGGADFGRLSPPDHR